MLPTFIMLPTLVMHGSHAIANSGRRGQIRAATRELTPNEVSASIFPILRLASSHFAPMALSAAVHLGIPDVIGDEQMSAADIAQALHRRHDTDTVDVDALDRTLRLLCAAGALEQSADERYGLTAVGALLQTEGLPAHQPSLACCVESWTNPCGQKAWDALPELILGRCVGARRPLPEPEPEPQSQPSLPELYPGRCEGASAYEHIPSPNHPSLNLDHPTPTTLTLTPTTLTLTNLALT